MRSRDRHDHAIDVILVAIDRGADEIAAFVVVITSVIHLNSITSVACEGSCPLDQCPLCEEIMIFNRLFRVCVILRRAVAWRASSLSLRPRSGGQGVAPKNLGQRGETGALHRMCASSLRDSA